MILQEEGGSSGCEVTPMDFSFKEVLHQLGWIDFSTLVILLVFFVLGLFRGLVWQLSRLLTLVLGFLVAGIWAQDLADFLVKTWPKSQPFALYAAYFAIFLGAFIVLSVIAWFLSGLIKKLKLTAYDRLGGGAMGILTGAAVVVLVLTVFYAFLPRETGIIQAAEKSRTKTTAVQVLRFCEKKLSFSFLHPVVKTLSGEEKGAASSGEKGTPSSSPSKGKDAGKGK